MTIRIEDNCIAWKPVAHYDAAEYNIREYIIDSAQPLESLGSDLDPRHAGFDPTYQNPMYWNLVTREIPFSAVWWNRTSTVDIDLMAQSPHGDWAKAGELAKDRGLPGSLLGWMSWADEDSGEDDDDMEPKLNAEVFIPMPVRPNTCRLDDPSQSTWPPPEHCRSLTPVETTCSFMSSETSTGASVGLGELGMLATASSGSMVDAIESPDVAVPGHASGELSTSAAAGIGVGSTMAGLLVLVLLDCVFISAGDERQERIMPSLHKTPVDMEIILDRSGPEN
ncbi:hypothetical protein SUNI508_11213 [Seiridium unicorne]|uniref:Uncharacterized protein n=1 Tax=Seiridium unicorne TaxID=138068 RepID=A0ABR2UIP0_9PEZI